MTPRSARNELGISQVNYVSKETVVVEFLAGGARPATDLERKMIRLLDSLCADA